jgi:hypothetical protein
MGLLCLVGKHHWQGCKCVACGAARDEQHDWSRNCERCARCDATRVDSHAWQGCKCEACGATRDEQHDWSKDCEKCCRCDATQQGTHEWQGCKCAACGAARDEQHDWSKDCEKCCRCDASRKDAHGWKGCRCTACGSVSEERHDRRDDCEKCASCGAVGFGGHKWSGCECAVCPRTRDEDHDRDAEHPQCRRCGRRVGAVESPELSEYEVPVSEWPQSQVEFIAVWYHGSNSSVPYSEAEILKRVSMVFGWRFEKSDPKEIKLCRATDTDLGVDWGLLSISAKQFGIEAVCREDLWTKEWFDIPILSPNGPPDGKGLIFWRNTPGFITGSPVVKELRYDLGTIKDRNTYRFQMPGERRVTKRAGYLQFKRGSYFPNDWESLTGRSSFNPVSIVINPPKISG